MKPFATVGRAELYQADCLRWLRAREPDSIHGVVTDPPFGLVEFTAGQLAARERNEGVWRLPPNFDGFARQPLPRFTTLTTSQLKDLERFYRRWARLVLRVLVPGAHVIVATTPHVSFIVSGALRDAGLQRRGELVRLVKTMRGGDRPKLAHEEFRDVSVVPRAEWEPWLLYRKPLEGRVRENLRKWKTGGLRRRLDGKPFGDVIFSRRTPPIERAIAPHPSLKPQAFLRQLVWQVLPFGEGVILDPFAGSGSTLAAAEALGLSSVGIETSLAYCELASEAIPKLAQIVVTHPAIGTSPVAHEQEETPTAVAV